MSTASTISKWKYYAPFGIVCALVISVYGWSAETGYFEIHSPEAKVSYYNLLVQGFCSGQLSVRREAPSELAQLSNPYDPAANATCVWDESHLSYEMSYYRGKLYLYFGVTPALVLFWPYALLTGEYCAHKDAVIVFDALGLLLAAWLIYSAWRRYFADTNVWIAAAGVLALGLAPCFMDQLSNCDLHEVPRSSGFAFTMLALTAIWKALHQPRRQILWLALASSAYGLAVGSRPSLLPGIVILLVPVVPNLWPFAGSVPARQKLRLLAAAILPAMLVGIVLAAYNFLRFGNPLEFGWRYQLTDIDNNLAQPFGWRYLWFNFRFYFLQPLSWHNSFPFIQGQAPASIPPHYYGIANPYGGILLNFPIIWLAPAAGLLWSNRSPAQTPALRRFLWAVLLVSLTGALTLCCFFCGSSSYLSDFMPALMMLAIIGGCSLESLLKAKAAWRWLARVSWCLLLVYSLTISILVGFKTHAYSNFVVANSLSNAGHDAEALGYFQKSITLDPSSSVTYTSFGNTCVKAGDLEQALLEYRKALERDSRNVEAWYDLSVVLIRLGRVDEAARDFQRVLELNPDFVNSQNPGVNNDTAWGLATDPDPVKRNGKIAVVLAESACRQTDFKSAVMIVTLAAAYAEAERFDDAIATAQKACALAAHAGEQDSLKKNQDLLSVYLKHMAYHETSGGLPTDDPAIALPR
jgi:Tetratricopeptide repeat